MIRSGIDYLAATLSKLYIIATSIIRQSLNWIGQFLQVINEESNLLWTYGGTCP